MAALTRREEILAVASGLIAMRGLRTSLQEITEAADILPGSLYHHFRSKDEILVELLRRYHEALDEIAEETEAGFDRPGYEPGPGRVTELGRRIAAAAVEHRAALQLTFYETPSTNEDLIELVRRPPLRLRRAMLDTLRAVRWSGGLRAVPDLPVVADRITQTMLHVGLDLVPRQVPPDHAVEVLGAIMLEGLASDSGSDARLDASPAFAAADRVVRAWAGRPPGDPAGTAGRVRAAARAEFARRGFETTTLRDIAAAAGVGLGTVHRVIGSKDDVLAVIMRSFGERVAEGWAGVLGSTSTPAEKLDAMTWININTLHHFPEEFRIQLAWMRQSTPGAADPGWSFTELLGRLTELVTAGLASGSLRGEGPVDLLARCVISVQFVPENILDEIGPRRSLLLARDTVLRGILGSRNEGS